MGQRDLYQSDFITLVLYMGKDKLWDGARSLYEMLEIDDAVKPFVNDYKLNLFDYHDYENFDVFKTENRLLFEILSTAGDKKKLKNIVQENVGFSKVDEESAKAILGILGIKTDLDTIKKQDEKGKKVYDMCKAVQDLKKEGKKEGEMQALKTVIKNLMKNQKITFDEAVKMAGISKSKQKKLQTLI